MTFAVSGASAQQGVEHPELTRARAELDAARGPGAYAALRRIWNSWDRADPDQVEAAIASAARSATTTPGAQAYAGTLAAHARTRRGDVASATARFKELGFVSQWLGIGPFDNEGKVGLASAFGPEQDFDKPIIPGQGYDGKERLVRWRVVPDAFAFGYVDAGALFRPDQHICAYFATFLVNETTRPRSAALWVGADGAFKLFFNGALTLKDESYRGYDTHRFAAEVTLEPGANRVTLKSCGETRTPAVSLRLASVRGGPLEHVTVSAQISDSEAALENHAPEAKPQATRLRGPVQEFERLVADPNARAEHFESYARYLVLTHGDDPTVHRARDLAAKAADLDPTLERLLLASELAEDRNRREEWLGRARALTASSGHASTPLLHAEAAQSTGSLRWRAAFPFYERLLASDPDDLESILGKAQLYGDAGLRWSALSFLGRAVERNPRNVTLLNVYGSQLRSIGRTADAVEVERRYANLRFDDHGFLSSQIELAVARRDRSTAEHWVSRLLALAPSSQWALGVAARAYQELGDPERTILTYERARSLAPEDVGTLRTLADLQGTLGNVDEQLALLREILRIMPQDKDVREYVEHIEPARPRDDEAYAWAPARFLDDRGAPAAGQSRRTLLDLTVTRVFGNGLSSKFRQIVFQPLTDSAAALSGQHVFQYQADRERVQLRGARVFRADGRIDEAVESGEGAANDPSISMYTSARTFYVQLPRLEKDDVVELRYRIDDVAQRNAFADYFGDVVQLQRSEPVAHAEYVLITPKSRTIYVDAQRIPGLTRTTEERTAERIDRFSAHHLPAITPEPAMPPWQEVLGFIHVSTYASYGELGEWYWGLARDQFDLDDETRRLVRNITKNAKTDREKVTAVYGWVVKNTRYVALEFGIYGFKPRRCVQTVARGWGDCKDKATVIVSMLRELGIESTIVILRTQMRGDFHSPVASLAPFDHAIAYVPSLDLYLDGTAEYTGSSELPAMDRGALGILVNEGRSELVELPRAGAADSTEKRHLTATLTRSGDATLAVDFETRGIAAPSWRRRYHAPATQRERVTQDLAREFPGFVLDAGGGGLSAGDLSDIEAPVTLRVRGKAPAFARVEGDHLNVPVTVRRRLTPRFASLSKRDLDVKLPALGTAHEIVTVKIPPGMVVHALPPEVSHKGPFGSYSVAVTKRPGAVTVTSTLAVDVDRVKPAQYAAFRTFCGEADAALQHRLILSPQ